MNKNAVIASNKKTILPRCYKSILVEGEIGIIIKKKCKNVSIRNAKNFILGYIICNDYSARDLIFLKSDNTLLEKFRWLSSYWACKDGISKRIFNKYNNKSKACTNYKY